MYIKGVIRLGCKKGSVMFPGRGRKTATVVDPLSYWSDMSDPAGKFDHAGIASYV
jgi:hypothetical protein